MYYGLDVTTRKANVLLGLGKFDLIISNPPYIKPSEKNVRDKGVLANEPGKKPWFGGARMAWPFTGSSLKKLETT